MKLLFAAALIAGSLVVVAAQEQEPDVPKDSALVSINGCAKNGNFIVGERREDQPGSIEIQPGRRFRLNGPKKLLEEIKSHQRATMQVTGVIRKADIAPPQGIGVLGGRVRIGGAAPQASVGDPARNPAYNQVTIDVRSWRPIPGDCR